MHMKMTDLRAVALGMTLTLIGLTQAGAQTELRQTGRKLVQERGEAIVTVRIVIGMKVSFGGQQQDDEVKREMSGTVVRPDGTTVVPLSQIDPAEGYRRMAGAQGNSEVTIDSQIKDLKLVVNKTQEVPATVVLRDPDLDIAVLQPQKKLDQPLPFIDLSRSATPQLLDQCVVLARMGRVANNELGVMTGEIQAIVTKPRRFYVPSAELASGGLGMPIFMADESVVGIVMVRVTPGGLGDQTDNDGSLVIIMPADDVKEVVDQAKPVQ